MESAYSFKIRGNGVQKEHKPASHRMLQPAESSEKNYQGSRQNAHDIFFFSAVVTIT